jgi:hypothetical protein
VNGISGCRRDRTGLRTHESSTTRSRFLNKSHAATDSSAAGFAHKKALDIALGEVFHVRYFGPADAARPSNSTSLPGLGGPEVLAQDLMSKMFVTAAHKEVTTGWTEVL